MVPEPTSVAAALQAASGDELQLASLPLPSLLNLRGRPEDAEFLSAVEATAGVSLPVSPNRWNRGAHRDALWLGPDEWLLIGQEQDSDVLEESIRRARPADPWLAVVDLTHNFTGFALRGTRTRELLAKGCSLDLHASVFTAGDCAQTLLAGTRVLLRALDNAAVDLMVRNSFAHYTAAWLIDAAAEFGAAGDAATIDVAQGTGAVADGGTVAQRD